MPSLPALATIVRMKRLGWVVQVAVVLCLVAACDGPKKPPMTPDNDLLGDAGIDMPEAPAAPAAPKK